jgi:hypothetical protein
MTSRPDAETGFIAALADAVAERLRPTLERGPVPITELSWRERLWCAPPETRLTVEEAAQALGRPTSWVYRRTSPAALARTERSPVPHRKLDGELVFVAGELRDWIRANEAIIQRGEHADA